MPEKSFEQWCFDLSASTGSSSDTVHADVLRYFWKSGSSPAEIAAILLDSAGRGGVLERVSQLLGEIDDVEAMQDGLLKSVKADKPLH